MSRQNANQIQQKSQTATPVSSGILQRKCDCGNHTMAGAECPSCQKKRGGAIQRAAITGGGAVDTLLTPVGRQVDGASTFQPGADFASVPLSGGTRSARVRVQPQLLITSPDDHYEQEADRIAELVSHPRHTDVSALLSAGPSNPATGPIRVTPFVQREASAAETPGVEAEATPEPALEARLLGGAGAGRPLSPAVRERMEERFGINFGSVRIHTGSEADRLADDIEALAFTHGRNIYFASGAYAPGTPTGDHLLAHELTHVIQQAGGASLSASVGAIQRARIRGPGFHAGAESRFLAANKGQGLITEAPLPGATTGKQYDFAAVGFPDLYKAKNVKNTAIGVRGEWEPGKGVNPQVTNISDDPDKKGRYVGLRPLERSAKGESGAAVTYSPIPQGDDLPFSAEFPKEIEVGDIKPIWMFAGKPIVEGAGLGTKQLENYKFGITKFVATAAADKKVERGTISAELLSGLNIPPELDFKDFEKENKSPSKNIIVTEGMTGPRRYWMFEPPGTGLYYYFHLAHPNPSPEARKKLEEAFTKLEPVKEALSNTPDDGIHSKLNLPKLRKRRSGALGRRVHQKSASAKGDSTQLNRSPTASIQRKDTPRAKKDWGALGKAWEQKRADWDRQYAKPFLGSKEGKALDERVAINNIIGLKGDTSPGSIAEQGKHLKRIELWSGKTGVLLGEARFLLGGAFDKVANAFEWIKTKITGIWSKVSGLPDKPGFSWRETLVNVLLKAVKLGFRELVSVFFELCANCLEGIFHKVVGKFTEDISQELQKHVTDLQTKFERYERMIKDEFEKRFGSWNQLIEDLREAQNLTSIVLSMEALIRLGLLAVSCLSPPALGCLWGIVVQVGLDVALNLIMGTEWFQKHVINHPSVREVIKQFAGPTIRSVIADTLRGVSLEEYAKGVEPCSKVKELDSPPVPPVDPVSPADFQARRAEWERVNRPQMLQDLQFRVHSKLGVPATEAELEQLVAAMGRSGKSPKELKEIIESTPKWKDGKYDLGAIRRRLTGEGDKPGPGGPGGTRRPEVGTSTRIIVPGGPRIEVGPRVFQPPPGRPPGEEGPTLPGVGIPF